MGGFGVNLKLWMRVGSCVAVERSGLEFGVISRSGPREAEARMRRGGRKGEELAEDQGREWVGEREDE